MNFKRRVHTTARLQQLSVHIETLVDAHAVIMQYTT